MGEVASKIRRLLVGIQLEEEEDSFGWVYSI